MAEPLVLTDEQVKAYSQPRSYDEKKGLTLTDAEIKNADALRQQEVERAKRDAIEPVGMTAEQAAGLAGALLVPELPGIAGAIGASPVGQVVGKAVSNPIVRRVLKMAETAAVGAAGFEGYNHLKGLVFGGGHGH